MADDERKFANLHYPGMQADPNEGRIVLDEQSAWRLAGQLECLGEDGQRRLLSSSAFVIRSSPLGVAITRKLLEAGLGRVGLFSDEPLSGAHLLGAPIAGAETALPAMTAWARREVPGAQLERFRETSIDRSLSDMTRGFDVVIAAGGAREAGQAIENARALGRVAIAAEVSGREAWCAVVPPGTVCEDCLTVPKYENPSGRGLYYPLLDFAAGWVATLAVEIALGHLPAAAFVETIDASRSPWARQTTEARPGASCQKCR